MIERQVKQIIITGNISVKPVEIPNFISNEDIQLSARFRLCDVITILEHHEMELKNRLITRLYDIVSDSQITISQIAFETDEPAFFVIFKISSYHSEHCTFNELQQRLPTLVSTTLTDFIEEMATPIGHWRVVINTGLKIPISNSQNKITASKKYNSWSQNSLALVFGLLSIVAVLTLFALL